MALSKAARERLAEDRRAATDTLRSLLSVGDVVRTLTVHTSRSGMTRVIRTMIAVDGDVHDVSRLVSLATGVAFDQNHAGARLEGCGMDMGFSLVYTLGRTLWPEGHSCTGWSRQGARDWNTMAGVRAPLPGDVALACPSNEHSNERAPHYNGDRVHSDGGYALDQRWL